MQTITLSRQTYTCLHIGQGRKQGQHRLQPRATPPTKHELPHHKAQSSVSNDLCKAKRSTYSSNHTRAPLSVLNTHSTNYQHSKTPPYCAWQLLQPLCVGHQRGGSSSAAQGTAASLSLASSSLCRLQLLLQPPHLGLAAGQLPAQAADLLLLPPDAHWGTHRAAVTHGIQLL